MDRRGTEAGRGGGVSVPLTFGEWFFVFLLPLSVLFYFAGVRDANYALETATNHRASVEYARARAYTYVRVCTHHSLTHARSLCPKWSVERSVGGKKTKFRGVSSKRLCLLWNFLSTQPWNRLPAKRRRRKRELACFVIGRVTLRIDPAPFPYAYVLYMYIYIYKPMSITDVEVIYRFKHHDKNVHSNDCFAFQFALCICVHYVTLRKGRLKPYCVPRLILNRVVKRFLVSLVARRLHHFLLSRVTSRFDFTCERFFF